jgi:hypothetical protein
VDEADAQHRAGAQEGGIHVRGAVIDVELLGGPPPLDGRPQNLLAGAGGLFGEPPRGVAYGGQLADELAPLGGLKP